jgi:arsenate reductase (glutaredoxin)
MTTLYHNPRCSKSRAALQLLHEHGVEPELRLYLEHPPTMDELRDLFARLGPDRRALVRTGEPEYAELALDEPGIDDDALIAAIQAHPRLLERPVFVAGDRAVIGRPPERVLELL